MWWMSRRRRPVGRSLPALWMLSILLGLGVLSGCGKKLDCDRFDKKAQACSVELYLALSGPETAFIERLVSGQFGLDDSARRKLEPAWMAERQRLARKLVERLGDKCRKDHGRYKQSEALQACLSRRSCKAFAACFAKALGVERPAGHGPIEPQGRKESR